MNNIKFLSMMAGAIVLTFASCKKDDLTKDFTSSDTQQNGNAKIRFVHVAPDLAGVSVKFNDISVVGDSIRYSEKSGYTDVAIGSSESNFKLDMIPVLDSISPGGDVKYYTPNETGLIASYQQANYMLQKDKSYTCFIIDTMQVLPVLTPSYSGYSKIITDNFVTPGTDSLLVRFYNASHTAGMVDITFTNNSTGAITSISNVAFLQNPTFNSMTSGDYNIEVKKVGATLATANNINLETGKSYTFMLRGIMNASGDKELKIDFVTNEN